MVSLSPLMFILLLVITFFLLPEDSKNPHSGIDTEVKNLQWTRQTEEGKTLSAQISNAIIKSNNEIHVQDIKLTLENKATFVLYGKSGIINEEKERLYLKDVRTERLIQTTNVTLSMEKAEYIIASGEIIAEKVVARYQTHNSSGDKMHLSPDSKTSIEGNVRANFKL